MEQAFRIATAQYDIGQFGSLEAYEAKISQWVQKAVEGGAKLLVFPEYFSMELASLFEAHGARSLSKELEALQEVLPEFKRLFGRLAEHHGITLIAGSFPVRHLPSEYRNRAYLFHPDGRSDHQDKLQMTRFENEQWFISAGNDIRTFETVHGRIGINICYDSEFPMIARRQVEAGADLIVVPSCTDTLAGYWRVRIGCQARALENQCFVVQSPTVGTAPWSEAVDINIGAAAVYTPVDYGFPDNGVLAIGALNEPQWVFADLDLAAIAHIRKTGQVFNYRDWPLQFRPELNT